MTQNVSRVFNCQRFQCFFFLTSLRIARSTFSIKFLQNIVEKAFCIHQFPETPFTQIRAFESRRKEKSHFMFKTFVFLLSFLLYFIEFNYHTLHESDTFVIQLIIDCWIFCGEINSKHNLFRILTAINY